MLPSFQSLFRGSSSWGGVHQGEAGLPGLLGHLPRGTVGGDRHQPFVRFSHTPSPSHRPLPLRNNSFW